MKTIGLATAAWVLLLAGGSRAQEATPEPPAAATPAEARPVIRTASELPRHGYRLTAPPSRLVDDPAVVADLARRLDAQAADTLARYDIQDSSARQRLLSTRMLVAAMEGRFDDALAFSREATALEEKPALRLTGDLELVGLAATAGAETPEAGAAAYQAAVAAALADLPPDVVRPRLIEMRRGIDLNSRVKALGQLSVYGDPVWQADTDIPSDYVEWMVATAADERITWPWRPALRAAITEWLEAHPAPEGQDIWPARSVTLTDADRPAPVAIGIWDVGVDRAVFEGRNAVSETLAFDEGWRQTTGDLKPTPEAEAAHLATYERYMRGRGVLATGRDDPDGDFARELVAGQTIEDIAPFEAGMRFYTGWIHGTHVAGVAVEGDPAIRIVPVRITWSDDPIGPPVDEARAEAMVTGARAAIAHMKAEGVRVANMSWGLTGENVEQSLAANNIEPDPARRTARAQAIFDTIFDGMSAAMAEAPEILFVIAAGNANEDLDFVRDMPGSINLPNVLSVGAVDARGVLTGFASTGRSVDLYALGDNIESWVPGGGRVIWSGASLAAPQVVNAAAKLLSVKPDLTTEQVVGLLTETATRSDEGVALLNTRAAVDRARSL